MVGSVARLTASLARTIVGGENGKAQTYPTCTASPGPACTFAATRPVQGSGH